MLVEVTYACKMGCTHCLSDCKPDGEHMTLEVFEDVLKFMIKNQIPTWSFSGGEMFEHPDILKMLSLIESYWKTLPIKYPITMPSFLHSFNVSFKKSGCNKGSPPEKVTPPSSLK